MTKSSTTRITLLFCLVFLVLNVNCGDRASRSYRRGLKFARQRKYEQAIVEMKRLLQIDPHSSKAHNVLGQLYRSRNLYNQAIEELKRAVELDEKDPVPPYNLGCLYRELEDWPSALQYYQQALERDPRFSFALYRLGAAYSDLGRPEEARTYFEEFLKSEPARPAPGYNNLGVLSWKEGDGAGAREEFRKALRLEAELPAALFNFGVVSLIRDDEKPGGVKALLKYLKLRPRSSEDAAVKSLLKQAGGVPASEEGIYSCREYIERGEQCEEAGQYRQAERQYLYGLKLDPDSSAIHYRLGLLYDNFLGDKIKAIGYYEKFLKAAPKSTIAGEVLNRLSDARSQVGEALLVRGDLRTPEPVFTPPRPKPPPTPPPKAEDYYRRGLALEKSGDLAGALSAYGKAVELEPEFGPAHFRAGMVYLTQGRYEKVRDSLQRARALDGSLPVRDGLGAAYLKLGESALSADRYEESLGYFRQSRKEGKTEESKEGSWKAHRAFAAKLRKKDEYSAAASHLDSCLKIKPAEAGVCLELGDIYAREMDRPSRARPYYEEFLRLAPRHEEASRVKRSLAARTKKTKAAPAPAKQPATVLSGKDHYNRGAAFHRKGDLAAAEKEYRAALKSDPGFYQASYNLGVIYNRTGRPSEALKAYKDAVRLKPDFARVHLALFNLYYHQFKMKNLARRHGRAYVKLEPNTSQGRLIAEWLGE